MDFRAPSRGEESDDAIRDAPYRPFYSIFGGQPILVKQYMPNSRQVDLDTDGDPGITSTMGRSSRDGLFLAYCCLITSLRMLEIMLRMREVGHVLRRESV
jgi:hypothetical protein